MSGWVYFLRYGKDGAIKIGTTSGNPHARKRALQTGAPETLHLLAAMPGDAALEDELHERFKAIRVRPDGEWFAATPELLGFVYGVLTALREEQPKDVDEWIDEPLDDGFGLTEGQAWVMRDLVEGVLVRRRFDRSFWPLRHMVDEGKTPDPRLVAEVRAAYSDLRGYLNHACGAGYVSAFQGLDVQDLDAQVDAYLPPMAEDEQVH